MVTRMLFAPPNDDANSITDITKDKSLYVARKVWKEFLSEGL